MARRSSALPEKIAQDLMQRILTGEYDDTSILPSERILQDSYGVSRTVVREALKLLAARGLVTTGNGQGAVVGKNLTAPAIDALLLAFHRAHVRLDDLLHTRLLIEPEVAALAAQHATPLQIRRLHELTQMLADLAASDQPAQAASRSYDLNAQFHTLLAQASQNPVLEILIALLVGIIWRQLNTVDLGQPTEQHARTAGLHETIVRAVAERDPAAARLAMLEHLEATRHGLSDLPGSLGGLIQNLYAP
ncbi:MAG TPA: FadR/GntR family transcriptional regulator [Roseiflexaceae bacterium]|nr:FadR/GntR family transcriptional regulator [Roseiflexaceae bacterium]